MALESGATHTHTKRIFLAENSQLPSVYQVEEAWTAPSDSKSLSDLRLSINQ